MKTLTIKEIQILNGMRTNEYNDAFENATWSFTAIDNSGMSAKIARGVISSLVKKELVIVSPAYDGEPEMIGYTEEGKNLFTNADGLTCPWGGPKLLKVKTRKNAVPAFKATGKPGKPNTKKVTVVTSEVNVVAFTGMVIGKFIVIACTTTTLTVQTKKSTLTFDIATGLQIGAKNPKFANRIK